MTTPQRKPHPSMSDVALALANRRSEPISTVTLTRNAKGDVQIAVDVNAESVTVAGKLAEREFKRLARVFPLSPAQKDGQKA